MFDVELFSSRLKLLRLKSGKSRMETAKKADIPLSSLGNYERGDKIPNASILEKLCNYYDTTADYLLGRTNDEKPPSVWPSAVPIGAVPSVDRIKRSVEAMLRFVCNSSYGLYTFECYAEIFEMLLSIDFFVEKKFLEIQQEYPGFSQFGQEKQMLFDGVPLLMALVTGDEDAIKFAKRLTEITNEIECEISRIGDHICEILRNRVFDAIQGKWIEHVVSRDARGDFS